MMSPWSWIAQWYWIADAVLGLLLAATLVMSIRLDRALRVVRRDRAAFEALIGNLTAAAAAVRGGVAALRDEADRATGQIGQRAEDADKMATDLSFLIEAAERASGKLEQRLQAAAAAPVTALNSLSAPVTAGIGESEPPPAPARPQAEIRDESRGELRELAGITTRRRTWDMPPWDMPRATPDFARGAAEAAAAPPAGTIKLAG
jgi:hypothetical protein